MKIYFIENEFLFSFEIRVFSFWVILYIGFFEFCICFDWFLYSVKLSRFVLWMFVCRCRVLVRFEFWFGWVLVFLWVGLDFLDSVWIFFFRVLIRRFVYFILFFSRFSFLLVVLIICVLNYLIIKDCLLMFRESILLVLLI